MSRSHNVRNTTGKVRAPLRVAQIGQTNCRSQADPCHYIYPICDMYCTAAAEIWQSYQPLSSVVSIYYIMRTTVTCM